MAPLNDRSRIVPQRSPYIEAPSLPENMSCAEYRRNRASQHGWFWRALHRKPVTITEPVVIPLPVRESPESPPRRSPETAWPGQWVQRR